jgi:hypothetical protein
MIAACRAKARKTVKLNRSLGSTGGAACDITVSAILYRLILLYWSLMMVHTFSGLAEIT